MTALAWKLIEERRTLVLATAGPEPWAAPVYYIYRNERFYFFSSPNCRHVKAALATGRCAGAIFRESDDWREIEGLQMNGTVETVDQGAEAIGVFVAYVRRFPTVREFFPDSPFDLDQFMGRFRSQLYAFVPGQVFYLNNQAGLGKRQEIRLQC